MDRLKDSVSQVFRRIVSIVRNFRPGRPRLSPRDRVMLVGCVILVIALVPFAMNYLSSKSAAPKTATKNGSSKNSSTAPDPSANRVIETPDYPTMLPEGKTADSLGGWSRVSPPDRDPAFAYADEIDKTPVTVTQQPLPESFKPNIQENLASFAKGYTATTELMARDTTVYVGTSAKGPQSIIFTKNKLLILIKSSARLESNSIINYVNSLR